MAPRRFRPAPWGCRKLFVGFLIVALILVVIGLFFVLVFPNDVGDLIHGRVPYTPVPTEAFTGQSAQFITPATATWSPSAIPTQAEDPAIKLASDRLTKVAQDDATNAAMVPASSTPTDVPTATANALEIQITHIAGTAYAQINMAKAEATTSSTPTATQTPTQYATATLEPVVANGIASATAKAVGTEERATYVAQVAKDVQGTLAAMPTDTATATQTQTATSTMTATPTATKTPTLTPSATATKMPSNTPTLTATATASATVTLTTTPFATADFAAAMQSMVSTETATPAVTPIPLGTCILDVDPGTFVQFDQGHQIFSARQDQIVGELKWLMFTDTKVLVTGKYLPAVEFKAWLNLDEVICGGIPPQPTPGG